MNIWIALNKKQVSVRQFIFFAENHFLDKLTTNLIYGSGQIQTSNMNANGKYLYFI